LGQFDAQASNLKAFIVGSWLISCGKQRQAQEPFRAV
jgi:hypothetical protein